MFSKIVLHNLIKNKKFLKKTIPYIKNEYFDSKEEKIVFKLIRDYVSKYKAVPSITTLKSELTLMDDISEHVYQNTIDEIDSIDTIKDEFDFDWLVDKTEEWVKESALNNAILKSAEFIVDKKKNEYGKIHTLVKEALSLSFDNKIGIDFDDSKSISDRWEYYNSPTTKYSTQISELNDYTEGGFERKTLSVIMAPTNAGKSVFLVDYGAHRLKQGDNVLYITLEMSEEKIAQRFEANIFNMEINDIPTIGSKEKYTSKFDEFKSKNCGKLIVKEYPTSTATVMDIEHLLDELKLKRNFVPDVLLVDYINIMASSRIKGDNTYNIIKAITEELRGLIVEHNLVGVSATQTNRSSYESSDINTNQTSESMGLPMTVDFMLGIIFPDELRKQNIQIWKILKNRFGGMVGGKFPVTVDFAKSRFLNSDDKKLEDFKLVNNDAVTTNKMNKEKIAKKINMSSLIDEEDDMFKFLD